MASMRPGMGRFRRNRRPWFKRPAGRASAVKALRWETPDDFPEEDQ